MVGVRGVELKLEKDRNILDIRVIYRNFYNCIHARNGIRTHDHSVRASEDSSCLKPLGYRDWLETEMHGESVPQCHFVYHKSHMT
jgi:hypothetical protein